MNGFFKTSSIRESVIFMCWFLILCACISVSGKKTEKSENGFTIVKSNGGHPEAVQLFWNRQNSGPDFQETPSGLHDRFVQQYYGQRGIDEAGKSL